MSLLCAAVVILAPVCAAREAEVMQWLNVVTVREYANVVASAKTRQRYVNGPGRATDGRTDTWWSAGAPGTRGCGGIGAATVPWPTRAGA